jgi:hypothetical protein
VSYKAIYAYASDVAETTAPGRNRTADTVIFTLWISANRQSAHLARVPRAAHLGRGRDYKLCVLKAEGLVAAHWAEIEAIAP